MSLEDRLQRVLARVEAQRLAEQGQEWRRDATALIEALLLTHVAVIVSRDSILREIGLSSARCRLLKTIRRSRHPLTVSDAAGRIGQSRQAVQRLAHALCRQRHLRFTTNPDNRRSPHLVLTAEGQAALERADAATRKWLLGLARGIDPRHLQLAAALLQVIRHRLAQRHDIYRCEAGRYDTCRYNADRYDAGRVRSAG